jgi:hypothetical protein
VHSLTTPVAGQPTPAGAPAAPAGSPASTYASRVGLVVSHDLFFSSSVEIQRQFSQIAAGGVSWVREDLSWAVAEPSPGVFEWASFDQLMTAASRTGIHVLGILDYSAPWASSDPHGTGDTAYPPKNNSDFAAYASAVTARYGSTGSFWAEHPELTPDPLSAVEIWNEPYGSWFWKPAPDPAAYAAMVRQSAPAIHAADPHMKVLMSGDLYSSDPGGSGFQPWLARLLADDPGIAKLVDALDVHPYPEPRNRGPYDNGSDISQAFGRVALIRQTEVSLGVSLPIWITEVGWNTAPDTPGAVSDQTQAEFLTDAVRRATTEWGSYVPKIFLFAWYRSNGVQGDPEQNYGLIDPSGTPKPAWSELTQLLGGSPGGPDPSASTSN